MEHQISTTSLTKESLALSHSLLLVTCGVYGKWYVDIMLQHIPYLFMYS